MKLPRNSENFEIFQTLKCKLSDDERRRFSVRNDLCNVFTFVLGHFIKLPSRNSAGTFVNKYDVYLEILKQEGRDNFLGYVLK